MTAAIKPTMVDAISQNAALVNRNSTGALTERSMAARRRLSLSVSDSTGCAMIGVRLRVRGKRRYLVGAAGAAAGATGAAVALSCVGEPGITILLTAGDLDLRANAVFSKADLSLAALSRSEGALL